MSEPCLRIGVIGAGGIAAKLHLPELSAVPGVEVAVLSGRKPSRLETLCRRFSVPRWTHSYEEVLADRSLDGVVIALPHPLHVRYGLMALDAGKHVFMQKPLSTSLDEAEAFVRATGNSDRSVLCLPYVARPHVLLAREQIGQGLIGQVASAHSRFSHGGPEVYYATVQGILEEEAVDELWFFDEQQADVGALFDMGVYAIAHLVALLGSVVSVTCRVSTVAKPTRLEDTAALILEFENGALGTAEGGWCDGARTYGFSVHGTDGKLVNPPLTGDLVHYRPSSLVDEDAPLIEQTLDPSGYPNITAHQHWIDCIRNHTQPPLANALAARHVTEILLKGLESSRERRTLTIESRV